MLLLSEHDVRRVLSMPDLIPAMESALVAFSDGRVRQPLRSVIDVGPERAYFGVMPAYVPEAQALGAKVVTVYAGNTVQGLPTHLATILLFDDRTGALISLMDGRYITEARTAAVSAVSVRHLARPDATRLGILGSGVQARSHVEAFTLVRPIERVCVYSPDPARRARFAEEMQPRLTASIDVASSAVEAVHDADIVLVAASAPSPILFSDWVADGAHVVSIGAPRPDQREMDPGLVARSRLFVDSRQGALTESGDIVRGIAEGRFDETHIAGEIGDVAAGRVAGRTAPGDTTLFKSLGMAVEDVVAADLAFRRAVEQRIGRRLEP